MCDSGGKGDEHKFVIPSSIPGRNAAVLFGWGRRKALHAQGHAETKMMLPSLPTHSEVLPFWVSNRISCSCSFSFGSSSIWAQALDACFGE